MWVKASIQLPDKKGTYNTRSDSEMVYLQRFFHNDGMPFMSQPVDMEWLDESSSTAPRLQEAAEWVSDAVEFANFIGDRALPEYSKSTNQWRWWDNDKPGYETATTEQLYTLFKTRPAQTKQ